MNDTPERSLYRVGKLPFPDGNAYKTNQEKYPDRPVGISDEEWNAWGALSFFDSEEGARRCGEEQTHLGNMIFRYDIPEDVGIVRGDPDDVGHVNVWGDKEVIRGYLVTGWVRPVKRKAHQAAKGQQQ